MTKLFRKLNKARYLKLVVTGLVCSVAVFTILMILCYFVKGGVPDTLIDAFYRWCGVEGGATMIIEVADKIFPDKSRKRKDNNNDERGSDSEAKLS